MKTRILLLLLLGVMFVGLSSFNGCGARQEGAGETALVETGSEGATNVLVNLDQIDQIVFVGLKECCACTRNRIDESWRVLQNVLTTMPELTVKRIRRDIDKEEALQLTQLRSMMVAPGIYFLNSEQGVVELLQGEVTEKQILALLDKSDS